MEQRCVERPNQGCSAARGLAYRDDGVHPTSQCHKRSSARRIGLVNRCANQRHVGGNDREALRSLEKRSCRKRIVQTSSLVVDDGPKLAGYQARQIRPLVQFESDGVRCLSYEECRFFRFTPAVTHAVYRKSARANAKARKILRKKDDTLNFLFLNGQGPIHRIEK
jgi:hypothetical protein